MQVWPSARSARTVPDRSIGMKLHKGKGSPSAPQGEAVCALARPLLRGQCSSAPLPLVAFAIARQFTGAVVPSPRPARPGHAQAPQSCNCAAVKSVVSTRAQPGSSIYLFGHTYLALVSTIWKFMDVATKKPIDLVLLVS